MFHVCAETLQSFSVRAENGRVCKKAQNAFSPAFYYSLKENDGGSAPLDKHTRANGGAAACARRPNLARPSP